MQNLEVHKHDKTLLVFNCHEAWVYQLGILGFNLDIIVGLKGRSRPNWDERIRPVPKNSRLITLSEALQSPTNYYCIITHNMTDLLDVKHRPEPKINVLHISIETRALEEKSNFPPEKMKEVLHEYLELIGGHAMAVTMSKGESWGFTEDVINNSSNPEDYLPYSGHLASGLRIANFIEARKEYLLWDFQETAFDGIPVRIVGHNPSMPGVKASKSWDNLKEMLQSYRFYIHTADPRYEDGFNMASLEAMAAGVPVLGNHHPTSPIEHGKCGFLSDDPYELKRYAKILLEDRDLAVKMGRQAQEIILERFSTSRFKEAFLKSIEIARQKCARKKVRV
jgi:glycosyltransferase involved in cell wall biosynthesis